MGRRPPRITDFECQLGTMVNESATKNPLGYLRIYRLVMVIYLSPPAFTNQDCTVVHSSLSSEVWGKYISFGRSLRSASYELVSQEDLLNRKRTTGLLFIVQRAVRGSVARAWRFVSSHRHHLRFETKSITALSHQGCVNTHVPFIVYHAKVRSIEVCLL
jgi:hypothetical protein